MDQRITAPVDRLTEKQRECLRLVWQHYESKQIARELGIKPDAVDGRIKTACRTLGVLDRYEAARILVRAEAGTDVRSVVYPPSDVPDEVSLMSIPPLFTPGTDQADHLAVQESQAIYSLSPAAIGWPARPLPSDGRRRNDLSPSAKLFWVAAIAIGTTFAFGVLASGLEALSRLT